MPSMTASGSNTGRHVSSAARRLRGPLYVFTSVALAAFMVTVMIGRKSTDRFTATAVLIATSNGSDDVPVDGQAVLASLQQPSHLQQVIDDLRRDEFVRREDLEAAAIQRQLTVESQPGRSGSGANFSVTCTASESSSATAIVNRLCNRYVHEQVNKTNDIVVPAYRGDKYAMAARAAEQADADHLRGRGELEAFLAENFGQFEGELNPDGETSAVMARFESVSLSSDSSSSASASGGQSLIARYRLLKRQLEEAQSQQSTARREERRQWEKKFDDRPAIAWQVDPAPTTRRQFSPVPVSRLALALSMGLVGGACVVFARRGTATIATVQQAKAVLSVPVVGTIEEPDGAARPMPLQHPWIARIALSASEWLLCGMLLSMILASMLDKHFAQHMRSEPLSALADGARCVVEIVWS